MIRVPARHLTSVALFVFIAIALGAAHGAAVFAAAQDQNDGIATIALRVEGMT